MMRLHHLIIAMVIHGAIAAVVRKPPAFAKPVYSDSYLPAAMQVIFHAVDQLKHLKVEELAENGSLLVPSTSPHAPGQQQPLPTEPTTAPTEENESTTISDAEKFDDPPEKYQEEALIFEKKPNLDKTKTGDEEEETNHELPEIVYGEPESSHEPPEINEEESEKNHAVELEGNDDAAASKVGNDSAVGNAQEIGYSPDVAAQKDYGKDNGSGTTNNCMQSDSTLVEASYGDGNKSAIDKVLKEIYSLVRESTSQDKLPDSSFTRKCIEGKSSPDESAEEEEERIDDMLDETRFTLLGERVVQVPRPSLSASLRRTEVPITATLRQLSELYDALSRDARKQGFSKFAGYSQPVLEMLEATAGGGAGPQLKDLLEKILAHNELTRNDALTKTKQIVNHLNDPSSDISTDLRRVLPLRFFA